MSTSARGSWTTQEGAPSPLGVTWIESEQAYNFALYSKHAERVTLLLYRDDDVANPVLARPFDHLTNKSGRVWHCRIPRAAMSGARYYAYAVDGPAPGGRFEWHAFDPDKILLDPYARSIFFPSGFDRYAAMRPGSNAGKAPLGFIPACEPTFDWRGNRRPRHEWDTVIYELHVQNNETSWLDWDRLDANPDVFRFFKRMIAFRKAHRSLGRSRFWRDDVRWYGVGPAADLAYHSRSLAFYLDGVSQPDVDLYVMINAYWEDLTFTVQEGQTGQWRRVIDTALDSPADFCEPGAEVLLTSPAYLVRGRSVVALVRPRR